MKNWKIICALGLGLSMISSSVAWAEEWSVDAASEHIVLEDQEAAGLVGGTGIVEGFSEDAEAGDILAQFEVVEPTEESYDTIVLAEGIEVKVADSYNTFQGVDGNFYVCPYREYEIPHVVFGLYSISGPDFFDVLTYEVFQSCENAEVIEAEKEVQIGDNLMKKIVYSYTMSGYTVRDTRLCMNVGDMVVVFGAKECPQENLTVGSLLEEVAGGLSVSQTGTGSLPGQTGGADVSTRNQVEYNFDITYDQSWANYKGVWIPFDDSYQIYLPAYWVYYEVSPEERAENIYYHCGNNGGDSFVGNTDLHLVVSKAQIDPNAKLTDMVDLLTESGYENVFLGKINGMEAIAYEITEDNLYGFLFWSPKEPGFAITVEGYYIGALNDNVAQMIQSAVCSVCPA